MQLHQLFEELLQKFQQNYWYILVNYLLRYLKQLELHQCNLHQQVLI